MENKLPEGKSSTIKTVEQVQVTVTHSSSSVQNEEQGGDAETAGSPLAAIVDLSNSLNRAREAIECGEDPGKIVQNLNLEFNKILDDLPQTDSYQPLEDETMPQWMSPSSSPTQPLRSRTPSPHRYSFPKRTISPDGRDSRPQERFASPSREYFQPSPPCRPQTSPSGAPKLQKRSQRVVVSTTNIHRDLSTIERGDDVDVGLEILRIMEMEGVLQDDYMSDEEVTEFLRVTPPPKRTWGSISPTLRSPSPVMWSQPTSIPDEPLPRFVRPTRIPKPDPPPFNWKRYNDLVNPPKYWPTKIPSAPTPRTPQQIEAARKPYDIKLSPKSQKECDDWIASLMTTTQIVDGEYVKVPPNPPPNTPANPRAPLPTSGRRRMPSLGIMGEDQIEMVDLQGEFDEEQLSDFLSTPGNVVVSETSTVDIPPVPADPDDEWESLSPSPPRRRVEPRRRVKPKKSRSASFVLPSRARTEQEVSRAAAAAQSMVQPLTMTCVSLEETPSGRMKKTVRFSEEIFQREIPSREELRIQDISERLSRYGTCLRPPRTASTYRPQRTEQDETPSRPHRPLRVPLEGPVYGPSLPYEYGSSRPPPRTAAGRLPYAYTPPTTPSRRPVATPPTPRSTPVPVATSTPQPRRPLATPPTPRSTPVPVATSTPQYQRPLAIPTTPRSTAVPVATSTPQYQRPVTPQQLPSRQTRTNRPTTPNRRPLSQGRTPPDPTRSEDCFNERTQVLQEKLNATDERIRKIECELFSPIRHIGLSGLPSLDSESSPAAMNALSISPEVTQEIIQGFVTIKRGVSRLQGIVQNRLEKGNRQKNLDQFVLR